MTSTPSKSPTKLHVFLTDGITKDDLELLIEKTRLGFMHWEGSEGYAAFNGYPIKKNATAIDWQDIGQNIFGVRLGYNPDTLKWHYLRIESTTSEKFYVEADSDNELKELVYQLFNLVRKVVRLGGEIAGGDFEPCTMCGKVTPHVVLYNTAHGFSQTVMSGSERKVCTVCETATYLTRVK